MKTGVKILPSLFTTGNIFCGFYAIIAAINVDYYKSAVAILIAIVFDGLDGRIARMTKATSDFGIEYDSLADIISFGLAPGLLLYLWVLRPFGRIGWLAVFLFIICGALRLARFNVQLSEEKSYKFIGLPIPASAGMIASYVILSHNSILFGKINPVVIAMFVYLLSFLMVSNIKYRSFKYFELRKRRPFGILIFTILFIYIIVTIPEVMIFFIFFLYVLSGPLESVLASSRSESMVEVENKTRNH